MTYARNAWQSYQTRTASWSPRARAATLGCGSLIVLCLVCAMCGGVLQALGGGTNAANRAQASATHTPKPTATLDPVAAYRGIVSLYATRLGSSMGAMGDDCQSGDTSACRDDAKSMQDDVHAFQSALDATPAPACLKETDGHLRAGLALFDRAAQRVMDGIDNNNTSLISKATTDLTNGGKELTKATDTMKAATC
jgi:hypothetical protein